MLTKNVYIGNIKKCFSAGNYKLYGDSRIVDNGRNYGKKSYLTEEYTKVLRENVVLIKVNKDYYIDIKDVNTDIDLVLYSSKSLIRTEPEEDNELFVDKKSLVPYFDNEVPKRIKIKQLKKIIKEKN